MAAMAMPSLTILRSIQCEDHALAPGRPLPKSGCPAEGDGLPEEATSNKHRFMYMVMLQAKKRPLGPIASPLASYGRRGQFQAASGIHTWPSWDYLLN